MQSLMLIMICSLLIACGREDQTPRDISAATSASMMQESLRLQGWSIPEGSYFPLLGPRPSEYHPRYWSYSEETLPLKQWNHRPFEHGVREVTIAGKYIVLGRGHSSRLWDRLEGRHDIKKLTIMAERLEIKSSLKLPGVELSIMVDQLSVDGGTILDLTPADYQQMPPQFSNGSNGLDGSKVTLFAHHVTAPPQFLLLNGGRGQSAGAGAMGAEGSRLQDLGGGVVYREQYRSVCTPSETGRGRERCREVLISKEGVLSCPANGGNARVGGLAGVGGRPGFVHTNLPQAGQWFKGERGASGRGAPVYSGGDGGRPQQALHQIFLDGALVRQHACPGTQAGQKADATNAPVVEMLQAIMTLGDFNEESYAKSQHWPYQRFYAEDLYRAGCDEEARAAFEKLSVQLIDLKKYTGTHAFSTSAKTQLLLAQMSAHLDFFGNPATWIPGVSFETSEKFYRKEAQHSANILYLNEWLQQDQSKREHQAEALSLLKTEVEQKHEALMEYQRMLEQRMDSLQSSYAGLNGTLERYQQHLQQLQQEIEDEARRNIHSVQKSAKLKRALLGLSALAKVIPAGQPALGGIGTSMEVMLAMQDDTQISERLARIPDFVRGIQEASKLEDSRRDWNRRYQPINVRELLAMNQDERRAVIERASTFYTPIIQTLKEQFAHYRQIEMSTPAIAAEARCIQETSERFQHALKLLVELNRQKQDLMQMLVSAQQQLQSMDLERQELWRQAGQIQIQSEKLENGMAPETKTLLNELAGDAQKRLVKYKYYMAKAFQYRLLKPFPGNLNLEHMENRLRQIAINNKGPDINDVQLRETLQLFYHDELARINLAIFEALDAGDLAEEETEVMIRLNDQELELLEHGESVYLDIVERRLIPPYHQNARLDKVEVVVAPEDIDLSSASDHQNANLDIVLSHPGKFMVRNSHQQFVFARHDLAGKGPYHWGTRVDLISGRISPYLASSQVWSLFRELWPDEQRPSVQLYTRPGALTELSLKANVHSSKPLRWQLRALAIRLRYSFNLKYE